MKETSGGPAPARARTCPRELAALLAALQAASLGVDYEDPAAEAAHYAAAGPVIEAVIAWPAACLAAFRLKAEAVVWAVGGDLVLGPAPTLQERLVDALLRDLLASSAQPDCAPCALEV